MHLTSGFAQTAAAVIAHVLVVLPFPAKLAPDNQAREPGEAGVRRPIHPKSKTAAGSCVLFWPWWLGYLS